jgi:pimeloyl-ACP methyl ester carboxylesterase
MQRDVGQHARSLARIIGNLDGITEIDFVAHSLGNLVVRYYLGDQTDPQHGRWPDRRIRRFVMLGPPNQGSSIAAMLADNKIFEFVAGPSGQQLGAQWAQIQPHLVTPACEFGIIAGGTQFDKGFNPLLKEDNDGLLTVESTKLAGAADFLVLPVIHACLVNDPNAMQCTLRFLEHGYFLSPADRHPLN